MSYLSEAGAQLPEEGRVVLPDVGKEIEPRLPSRSASHFNAISGMENLEPLRLGLSS